MNEKTKASVDKILACMAGEDGGVAFVRLRALLETMEKQSSEGDKNAAEVLETVHRFARLIDVANGRRL